MKLYYDKTAIATIADVLSHYTDDEFESPYRSTVASLSWLKHEISALDSLLKELEMPEICVLHLEYKVRPPLGDGEASHTDLMVMSGDSSLAIEAKWTEPRYPIVSEWLQKGSNPHNRREVFAGWLNLLQKHAMCKLRIEDFSDVVYQMVHRAASACAAGGDPRMAYVVFEPSPDPKTAAIRTLRDDLTHLWSLLGNPKGFPFCLVEVPLSPTPAFTAIASLPKGQKATAEQVKAALFRSDRLFNFEKYRVMRVGARITIPTSYVKGALVEQPGITVPEADKI